MRNAIEYLNNIIPEASIKFLPLFSYETSDALKRNKDHFLWLKNPFKDSFANEKDIYKIHETQKIKLSRYISIQWISKIEKNLN